tara:strand:- start:3666 stop:4133 length:468 start_codon:yes stop_codon:yes gene_type:complete
MGKIDKGWATKRNAWEAAISELGGEPWRSSSLTDSSRERIPRKSGLYMIASKVPTFGSVENLDQHWRDFYNVLYIGQASDLFRRFKQHLKGKAVVLNKTYGETDFLYCTLEMDKRGRERLEALLVKAFGPTMNEVIPFIDEGDPVNAVIGKGQVL